MSQDVEGGGWASVAATGLVAPTAAAPGGPDRARCDGCGATISLDVATLRCSCGGTLSWSPSQFRPSAVDPAARTIWRYRHSLPASASMPVTLGEGATPLVAASWAGVPVWAKLEFCNPSGSYKDRGSAVVAAALATVGVTRAVEDSSGNAGASLAGYLARTGCQLQLFVPRDTPGAKLRQARTFGAAIDATAGSREAAADMAAVAARAAGAVYASHVYSPYFLAGLTTLAYELWEDLDGQPLDDIVVPAGNGLLVLGLWQGLGSLMAAGLLRRMPRLHAVQAAACAPLATAWLAGEAGPRLSAAGATAAAGVRVASPARGAAVLAAVRASGGSFLAVEEPGIAQAVADVASAGWWVEPTGALAVAALPALADELAGGTTVVLLTGSGLKS